jgi:drug/metabolite transporter (DMT)-like permease
LTSLPSSWTGLIYAFVAAVCYAGLNTAIRFADVHMSIWHIIFYRSLFGVMAMGLLAWMQGLEILGRQRPTLGLLGLAGALGVVALTVALILLPLFEALVLFYLFPTFSALLSPWLTRDRVPPGDWLCIGTACVGTALVLWSGKLGGGFQWGHFLALCAALCLGLTFTLTRRVSADNSPLTPFFYICAAGIAVSIGPVLLQPTTLAIPTDGLPALAAVAVLATAAHLAGNKALVYLPSPRVGVILMSEVIFGAIIGLLIFDEFLGMRTLLGGVLIIGSGIGLNFNRRPS